MGYQSTINAGALARLRAVDTLLFGLGAQKSGTTWLHAQLSRHAGFHFARKEFSYWNAVRSPYSDVRRLPLGPLIRAIEGRPGRALATLAGLSPNVRKAVLNWKMLLSNPLDPSYYAAALLDGGKDVRLTGDISPTYALLSARTYAEMHGLCPNAKFIFIMRDPVERLWSGICHRCRPWFKEPTGKTILPLRLFDEAVSNPLNTDFEFSDYRRTISALREGVPAGAILLLFYEVLFTDETMRRVAEFLNVEPFQATFDERIHRGAPYPVKPGSKEIAAAREALAPTYEFVFREFGDSVPERWHRYN